MPKFRFKVRARKAEHVVPCAPELTTLLSCFASSGDLRASEACAEAAKGLQKCMASAKPPRAQAKPAINYLLRKAN